MWMQALGAGGVAVLGDAFPLDWKRTFADANVNGFFESSLWNGINSSTNPDPATGAQITAEQMRDVAAKVFLPGLVRSHREYLDRVIVSLRDWRSFEQSRLRADVIYGRAPDHNTLHERAWRWWHEVTVGVTDVVRRGYPCRVVDYDAVLADPEGQMRPIFDWLHVDVDVDAALAAVQPALRTQADTPTPDVPQVWVDAFDEVQHCLREGPLTPALVERMAVLNKAVFDAKAHQPKSGWR
jgi:hypothetical protein